MQWRWWDELGELLVRTQQGTSIRNGLCRWTLQMGLVRRTLQVGLEGGL